jgi:hypothetical protein
MGIIHLDTNLHQIAGKSVVQEIKKAVKKFSIKDMLLCLIGQHVYHPVSFGFKGNPGYYKCRNCGKEMWFADDPQWQEVKSFVRKEQL